MEGPVTVPSVSEAVPPGEALLGLRPVDDKVINPVSAMINNNTSTVPETVLGSLECECITLSLPFF